MKRLSTLRSATLGVAAIAAGASLTFSPAMAIPIRGVQPSIARSPESGPRPQGPFSKTAGISSGTSVAKGRPMVLPASTSTSDWLLGMKR